MHTEGDPWPGKRYDHIAACLGYGGQHKTLLISGGYCNGDVLDDMRLLDLQSRRMEKVRLAISFIIIFKTFSLICGSLWSDYSFDMFWHVPSNFTLF